METDGKLSVMLKAPYEPVRAQDLGIVPRHGGLPTDLVRDGVVLEGNLKDLNLSKDWLFSQLRLRQISSIEDVFLAQVDNSGTLYIDLKKDWG